MRSLHAKSAAASSVRGRVWQSDFFIGGLSAMTPSQSSPNSCHSDRHRVDYQAPRLEPDGDVDNLCVAWRDICQQLQIAYPHLNSFWNGTNWSASQSVTRPTR
jgi:hypothetical protein